MALLPELFGSPDRAPDSIFCSPQKALLTVLLFSPDGSAYSTIVLTRWLCLQYYCSLQMALLTVLLFSPDGSAYSTIVLTRWLCLQYYCSHQMALLSVLFLPLIWLCYQYFVFSADGAGISTSCSPQKALLIVLFSPPMALLTVLFCSPQMALLAHTLVMMYCMMPSWHCWSNTNLNSVQMALSSQRDSRGETTSFR
jgi:hypothetical protein